MPNESQTTASLLSAAIGLHKAGNLAAAQAEYARVLEQEPNNAEALYLSGAVDYQTGALEGAAAKLAKSLAARAGHLPAIEMLGAVSVKRGQFDEAARCFEMAALQKPTAHETHYNHGFALFNLGAYAQAADALRKALALKAGYAPALYLYAVVLRLNRQLPEAAAVYGEVVKSQPENIPALDEYGGVLYELGQFGRAEAILHQAIFAAPHRANPYTNLGRMFQSDPARAAEALALHERAIARDPNNAEAHNNRGVTLYSLGRFHEAVTSCRQAIVLKPTLAEAHHNLAQALLTVGDMASGWIAYEWRWKCHSWKTPPRHFTQPTWTGEDLGGKRLLVWGEQGIGDELLQGSMVADLAERGMNIAWETEPRLVPLIKRSYPNVHVVARTTPPDEATQDPSIGAQISALSLGRYVRTDIASFPKRSGYLKADPVRTAAYRKSLLSAGKTKVIGVSWISTNADAGKQKSSALKSWAPIWKAAGKAAHFVDLQYSNTTAERAGAKLDLTHLAEPDLLNDLDGLAALIAACDVVVTVSNTTAHMAGALGVPVYVMIPGGSAKLWYWGADEGPSLWYPSAQIFRQPRPNAWDDVIARVAERIAGA